MAIRLLGPVEVVDGENVLDLGGPRPIRALVALAVADQNRLSIHELAERCFDDGDRPEDPIPAIRTAIRRLRRAMGDDAIITRSGGYELNRGLHELDMAQFDTAIAAARAADDPVQAAAHYRLAIDLWRGSPFGELGELPWMEAERIRLEEQHVKALEGWHDAQLRAGTATEILPSLAAAVRAHPLQERLHRQLMHGLFLADRQADALRAFQDYREVMADVGLEPSADAVALERQIAAGDPDGSLLVGARALRGYQLHERLGEGAFSIVFRGDQPSVDRPVAIKQIRSDLADQPEFIRRFEAEARLVARLEHPHIVPLYDFWREPGSAYLVMRLLTNGSLESSLLSGRWSVDRVARMVEQIGSALAYAHASGVIHRDVKPANILLDADGNTYLTDFGIATRTSDETAPEDTLSVGSPAYASPEQLRRESVNAATDVHGFAISVFEALCGHLPFPNEPSQAALLRRQLNDPIPPLAGVVPGVSHAVDDVLARATAKQPEDRIGSIEEFADALLAALQSTAAPLAAPGRATTIATEERNPYKGLRAFDEADASDFSGRDRLVTDLLQRLDDQRFVTVVGPSGSGKSSAVRAGLIPALRRGRLPGSEDWFITAMTPGSRPFEELEAALVRVATTPQPDLLGILSSGERGLSRALRRVIPDGGRLVLVIDQFEELFTLGDDARARQRFLDGLAAAVADERAVLRVVVTIRADFYDRPLAYPRVGRLVRDGSVAVVPMAADELERAITEPAARVGCSFEPGLVAEILADVADRPGALPLLQFALTEVYERRVGSVLTRAVYRELGGLAGALTDRAEMLYSALDDHEQAAARRLFGRLVTLGEAGSVTRRVVARSELVDAGLTTVADHFGDGRLLRFDRHPASREPTIEIAHEALLVGWDRLSAWLDDDRDDLLTHRNIASAAATWEEAGRDAGDLYRGPRLAVAESWAETHGADLAGVVADFLAASTDLRSAERESEERRLEDQMRSNRRLRGLLVAVGVVAILALLAGVIALDSRSDAQDAASEAALAQRNAEVRRMVSDATALMDQDRQLALLVAAAAYDIEPNATTLGGLQATLARADGIQRFIDHSEVFADLSSLLTYTDIRFVDETTLMANTLGRIDLWDVETGRRLAARPSESFFNASIRFAEPVGSDLIAVATSGDRRLRLIDVATGTVVKMTEPSSFVGITSLRSDADHGRVAMAVQTLDNGAELLLLDLDLDVIASWSEPAAVRDMVLLDGLPIVIADGALTRLDQTMSRVWDADMDDLRRFAGVDSDVPIELNELASAPHSATVYAYDPSIGVWEIDAQTGRPTRFWTITADDSLSPDLRTLHNAGGFVLAGRDLITLSTGEVRRFPNLDRFPAVSALSPSGASLAFEGSDGFVVWHLDGSQLLGAATSRGTTVAGSFTVDGEHLLTITDGDRVSVQPALDTAGDLVELAIPHAVAPSGYLLRQSPTAGMLDVVDGASLDVIGKLDRATIPNTFELSIDLGVIIVPGRFLNEEAGTLRVHDLETGTEIVLIDGLGESDGQLIADHITRMEFSPDGALLLTITEGGRANLIDTNTWQVTSPPVLSEFVATAGTLRRDQSGVTLRTPDGTIVSTRTDGSSVVVDGPGGVSHEIGRETDRVETGSPTPAVGGDFLRYGPDDRWLVVGTPAGAYLFDPDAGESIGQVFSNDRSFGAGASADGRRLVTAVDDSIVVWELDFSRWRAIACDAAGRDITEAEWARYAPPDEPYRPICE